jgi:thiamine monophosphate synthase
MRETDAAAEAHAGNPTEYSEETLTDAVTAEIEAGLDAFRARNPDASDDEIQAEAERIGDQIVDRNGNNDDVSDVVETVVNDYD